MNSNLQKYVQNNYSNIFFNLFYKRVSKLDQYSSSLIEPIFLKTFKQCCLFLKKSSFISHFNISLLFFLVFVFFGLADFATRTLYISELWDRLLTTALSEKVHELFTKRSSIRPLAICRKSQNNSVLRDERTL